ncbi:MAG TPA: FixH family protein, partial [Gemmatimonas sp.]|uniref:FixH family protein n=1 Tax=Gemmatimonas sp. TaxID=1962908 RepID=UPI002ED81592
VILGSTVVANIAVMRIANDDPSFAVEPNYYAKAVAFDSTMAQERRNLDLGWGVETFIDSLVAGQPARVVVKLKDAAAAPLAGAHVVVMARFNARANDTLTAVLHEDTAGLYSAALPIVTPGEWEVRVSATQVPSAAVRDTARYSVSTRVTVSRAGKQ